MADKRISTCCKREIAHKKDGTPYTHKCYALPEDPFVVPGQLPDNNPDAKRGAVDPFAAPTKPRGKSPFDALKEDGPGPWFSASYDSECATCDGAIFAGDEIRADGQGGYECRANCEQDEQPHEDDSPVTESLRAHSDGHLTGSAERPPYTFETAPLEPTEDHRKWCTRCKLIGHYASDCTTAVLEGGVVSVPEPAPYTGPKLADPDGSLTRRAIEALNRRTPEQKAETAARMDARVSALLGLPLEEAGGECECGRGTSNDNEVCDTCAEPKPDPFTTPTQTAEVVNVSGQPAARYEWRGKQNYGYLVKLPETGDFRRYGNGKPKGLTRATTFNKAASDSNALSEWGKRNVLIGASLRPDLVAKAHGLNHETGKGDLMKLVAELETAAGAKVSADIGTLIHELTERWDAGTITIKDVPAAYKDIIGRYGEVLQAAGLRPVPGLIERTTYIPEFGGVVGTLDRVYYHERSGQYVIGDVKTGKTLEYGMDEIETQEWIYAHGVNLNGVYDWNTDTWQSPKSYGDSVETGPWSVPEVSEEWGVVVHMPVQGDDAGQVKLVRADLQRGKRHAQVCHDVREERSNKPKPEPWTGEEFAAEEREKAAWEDAADWPYLFARVPSEESAALLWQQAHDAGVPPEELKRLVVLASDRLKELAARPLSWVEQAERVMNKEDAADVWQRASAAGVQGPELDSLVAIMQREIS